jgi:hypothetical protein
LAVRAEPDSYRTQPLLWAFLFTVVWRAPNRAVFTSAIAAAWLTLMTIA